MRRRPTLAVTALTSVFAIAALAIAALPWWPVYRDPHFVLVVATAILAGTAVSIAGALLRWPSWTVLLTIVVVFLATGVQLAIPSETLPGGWLPSADGLGDLVTASALGWRQLLTITIPVGTYQTLLVPLYLSVLAASTASVSMALRLSRAELGTIPPLLLFVAGVAFGPAATGWGLVTSIAELAVVLLWIAWRRSVRRQEALKRMTGRVTTATGSAVDPPERSTSLRGLIAAALVLMLASGAAVAVSTLAPETHDRVVLRSLVEQPFDPRRYASPLSGLRSYLKPASADKTMLRVTGLPQGGRIRIATLDSYDGVVFAVGSSAVDSASGTFSRVPTTVDQSSVAGTREKVTIDVEDYSGVWLPTTGDLESISFHGDSDGALRDDFFFNATSGTAAEIGGVKRGDSYTLTAVDPTSVRLAQLKSLTPGAQRTPDPQNVPDAVRVKLAQYDDGVEGRGAQLVAAIQGLRDEGYISHGIDPTQPPSRSGHSADRITELLTGTRMIGDAEQYAVAAALMANQLGFPVRVVYGFAPRSDTSGTLDVTGSDITAWIEVGTSQNGWVAIDPVPDVRPIPDEQPQQPTQISRPQTPVEPPPDDQQTRDQQSQQDPTQPDDTGDPVLAAILVGLRIGGIVLAAAAVVALPFLVVVAVKARRRWRRRRAPTPARRITGAWDEFRDSALDFGYVPAGRLTRIEFAERLPLEQPRTLAAVADRAVFAPDPPDGADADRVWVALGEIRDSLGRGLTRWQRFRARVSLRSLRGRS